MRRTLRTACLLLLLAGGCSQLHPNETDLRMTNVEIQAHPWYHRQHHEHGGGFKNILGKARVNAPLRAFKWIATRPFQRKENAPTPVVPLDPQSLREAPERLRLTWIGHSTMLVQTPSQNLLLDPQFSDRASPFSFAGPDRRAPLPLAIEALPPIGVVLISHDHYDHLDEASIRALQQRFAPVFLVPLGVGGIVRGWGAERVLELDWWQYVDLNGIRYHCTPAKHFSGRALTNRDQTLWAGWYLVPDGRPFTLFYAGDTAYAEHFGEIRERLGAPEVALIPIGAYLPRWFMEAVHVDPEEAVQAFLDLRAEVFIPVHWGTFDLADEPLQEPAERTPRHAAERGVAERLHLLPIGGSFTPGATPAGAPPTEVGRPGVPAMPDASDHH